MTTSVKDAGAWKTVDPDGLYVKDAGVWKQAQEAYVKDSGTWKKFHQRSDPLDLVSYPIWTNSFGEGHLQESTDIAGDNGSYGYPLLQGDWDNLGHPSGMGIVHGVIRFDDDAIIAAFGDRKACTSIELTLHARNTYDGAVQAKVHTSIHGFTNTRLTSLPWLPQKTWVTTSGVMNNGGTTTFPLPLSVGDGILGGHFKALILYDDDTTEKGKGLYRFIGGDSTSPVEEQPTLSMTADYSRTGWVLS